MKISHHIARRYEGTLSELLELDELPPNPCPSLDDVLAALRNLRFIVEVTPQLQGNATAARATHEAAAILSAFGG